MTASPFVSIIIPTYNAEKTIARALQSIVTQTYKEWEILLCDAKSTDQTLKQVEPYASHISFLISEPDQGIADAWNKGICKARGEWLYFLGADDFLWDVNVLEKFSHLARSLTLPAKVIYGQVATVNKDEKPLFFSGEAWEKIAYRYRQISCLPHQAMFQHKSIFEEFGKFDLAYKIAADYALFSRVFAKYPPHFVANFIVAGFTLGGMSTNLDYRLATLYEIKRAQKTAGVKNLRPILFWNIVKTKLRLWLLHNFGEKLDAHLQKAYRFFALR